MIRDPLRRSRILLGLVAGLLLAVLFAPSEANACGEKTDCQIGDRTYRVRMPDGHDGRTRIGAVVFMHGHRAGPDDILSNHEFTQAVSDLGIALVLPKSSGAGWDIPGSPGEKGRVEIAFFDQLLTDVARRFPIDTAKLVASGFSAGGMMVWNLACERGDRFVAFVPIAGTFWQPEPTTCPRMAADIFHVHGTDDGVVPLAGRQIRTFHQGDVARVFEIFTKLGQFAPGESLNDGELTCDRRRNPAGHLLELCLHAGGHIYRAHYVTRVWTYLIAQKRL